MTNEKSYISWLLNSESAGYMTCEEVVDHLRKKMFDGDDQELAPLKKKGRPVGSKNKIVTETNGTIATGEGNAL